MSEPVSKDEMRDKETIMADGENAHQVGFGGGEVSEWQRFKLLLEVLLDIRSLIEQYGQSTPGSGQKVNILGENKGPGEETTLPVGDTHPGIASPGRESTLPKDDSPGSIVKPPDTMGGDVSHSKGTITDEETEQLTAYCDRWLVSLGIMEKMNDKDASRHIQIVTALRARLAPKTVTEDRVAELITDIAYADDYDYLSRLEYALLFLRELGIEVKEEE